MGDAHAGPGPPRARPELAVEEEPLELLALLDAQGLGERAGHRDEEHALRVPLDANAVGSRIVFSEDVEGCLPIPY